MLKYKFDLSKDSFTIAFPPNTVARSFPFRASSGGYFDAGEEYFTTRSDHNSYLLFYTTEGAGTLRCQNQSCRLTPNTVLLLDCRRYHEYRTEPGGRWRFHFVHLDGLEMAGYAQVLLSHPTPVTLRNTETMRDLFVELEASAHHAGVAAAALQSHLLSAMLTEAVCSLAESGDSTGLPGRDDIADLAQFIDDNCELPLSMEDFTRHTRLTKHHLIRLFERQIGMPPYRYMHLCRVSRAEQLLRGSSLSVGEIAEAVGYSDTVVFIRHFKFFHNITPGAYRKETVRPRKP